MPKNDVVAGLTDYVETLYGPDLAGSCHLLVGDKTSITKPLAVSNYAVEE